MASDDYRKSGSDLTTPQSPDTRPQPVGCTTSTRTGARGPISGGGSGYGERHRGRPAGEAKNQTPEATGLQRPRSGRFVRRHQRASAVLPGGSGRVTLERIGLAEAFFRPVQAPASSTARSRTA